MAKNFKRIVIVSDMHCGHKFGLVTPDYQISPDAENPKLKTQGDLQRTIWEEYTRIVTKWYKPDLLVSLSDAIDGSASKNSGVELVTTDRRVQCHMAADCLTMWKAKNIILLHGTAYHTGDAEDWDAVLADLVNGVVNNHGFVKVTPSNKRLYFRHHIGRSSVPHGRHTAPAKELMWLKIWSEDHDWPKTDVAVFGHVHYYTQSANATGMAFTCPSLQLMTNHGERKCTGDVNWGVLSLKVYNDGTIIPEVDLVNFVGAIPEEVII